MVRRVFGYRTECYQHSGDETLESQAIEEKQLGEMAERPIVQHWKCCVPEMVPGVRIPLSPLIVLT